MDPDEKDLTVILIKRLFEGYEDPNIGVEKIYGGGITVTYADMIKQGTAARETILVFGGHGQPNTLLAKNKVFYDKKYFPIGPKSLFAFCCYAGRGLGKSFAKDTTGTFLGFNSFLGLQDDEVFFSWLQKIFYPIISEIYRNGSVNEDIYTQAIDRLNEGADYYFGKDVPRAMCLTQMIKTLCQY
jgi:hypothetical protein